MIAEKRIIWTCSEYDIEESSPDAALMKWQDYVAECFYEEYERGQSEFYTGCQTADIIGLDEDGKEIARFPAWAGVSDCGFYKQAEKGAK